MIKVEKFCDRCKSKVNNLYQFPKVKYRDKYPYEMYCHDTYELCKECADEVRKHVDNFCMGRDIE